MAQIIPTCIAGLPLMLIELETLAAEESERIQQRSRRASHFPRKAKARGQHRRLQQGLDRAPNFKIAEI